jgi:hypothetical protein
MQTTWELPVHADPIDTASTAAIAGPSALCPAAPVCRGMIVEVVRNG